MNKLKLQYGSILIIFIILATVYTPTIKSNADFNYNFQINRMIGTWNHEGQNSTELNNPMDIFANQSVFVISDLNNGRILLVNKANWNVEQIIYPYTLNPNGTKHFVKNIYQTIITPTNNYFSVIENATIIEYNGTGQIFNMLKLYNAFANNSLQIDLGIDITTNPFQILLKYPVANMTNDFCEGTFLFLLNQTSFNINNSKLLLKTSLGARIEIGEQIKFSYYENHPLLTASRWYGITNDTIVLLEFGQVTNTTYNVTRVTAIPILGGSTNDFSSLVYTGIAWVNFTLGFWIADTFDFSSCSNWIYSSNYKFAGTFCSLLGYNSTFNTVSSIWYDPNTNLVIVASPSNNVVVGLQFESVTHSVTTLLQFHPSFYDQLLHSPALFIIPILLIICIGLFAFFYLKRKK